MPNHANRDAAGRNPSLSGTWKRSHGWVPLASRQCTGKMPVAPRKHRPRTVPSRLAGHVLLAYSLCAFAVVAHAEGPVPTPAPAAKTDRAPPGESPVVSAPTPCTPARRTDGGAAPPKPFAVPDAGSIPLLPLGRVVTLTKDPQKPAWTFSTEPPSGSFVEPVRDPQGARHDAVSVYCYRAWVSMDHDVRGAMIEFPLRLPQCPVQLRVAMAFFNPFGEAGDKRLAKPVAWRVRVRPFDTPFGELGPMIFEWHAHGSAWQEAIVDLSDFAGQAIWLQLATPATRGHNDAYWVEPTLVAREPQAP